MVKSGRNIPKDGYSYETRQKLQRARKNTKINDLLNGDWIKYGETKEKWTEANAEFTLCLSLMYFDLSDKEIDMIMLDESKIRLWGKEKKKTLKAAREAYLSNPNRFFFDKKFVAKKLSDEIMQKDLFVSVSTKSPIWIYNREKGIWEDNGHDTIKAIAQEKLDWKTKEHYKKEAMSFIRDGSYQPIEILGAPKGKIVCGNGVYDLDTGELGPYDPELYALTKIPALYDPAASCPKIDLFLTQILHPDDVDAFYELVGYCLYKGYPIARIFIFYGEQGRNGKSRALGLIDAFLGTDNTSSINLQALTDDGFRSSGLHGKLANICGDIPGKPIENTGLIKKITGGDKVTFEKKYYDAFDSKCATKLIFSANQVPPPKYDDTGAFYRRMNLYECPNSFKAGEPGTDPKILDKITTPEELSGLFNKAIAGLKKLLERGKFKNEKDEETKQLEYMKESDPIKYFAKAYITQTLEPEYFITNEQLYNWYVFVCNGIKKIPTNNSWFPRQLRRYIPFANFTTKEISNKKTRVVKGIKVDIERIEKEIGGGMPPDTADTADTPFNPMLPITQYTDSTTTNKGENGVSGVSGVSNNEKVNHNELNNEEVSPNELKLVETAKQILKNNAGKMSKLDFYELMKGHKHDFEIVSSLLHGKYANLFTFDGPFIHLKEGKKQ